MLAGLYEDSSFHSACWSSENGVNISPANCTADELSVAEDSAWDFREIAVVYGFGLYLCTLSVAVSHGDIRKNLTGMNSVSVIESCESVVVTDVE